MIYSEAAYFDGNHCQHCADRDEKHRLDRKKKEFENATRYATPPRISLAPQSQPQTVEGDYCVVYYLEDFKS